MRRLLLPLVGVLLLVPALPAQAETWSAKDRRADVQAVPVRAHDPGDDDCSPQPVRRDRRDERRDVLGLGVDHGPDLVTVTVAMRDIASRDADTSYALVLKTDRKSFDLSVGRYGPGGEPQLFLSETPDYPDPEDLEGCYFATSSTGLVCEEMTADLDTATDLLTVTLPRTCLRSPRWVRVGLDVYGFARSRSGRPTSYYDTWSRHGAERNGFIPPLSPRVRQD